MAENRKYLQRAEMALQNVRFCNSGCDVHAVGNIRNTAILFIDAIKRGGLDAESADRIIKSIEKRCTDFFRQKFSR